jgi:hypothetical protein
MASGVIKKLGRIERPSHRVTGDRTDRSRGAGWKFLFVAVDDHARRTSSCSRMRKTVSWQLRSA